MLRASARNCVELMSGSVVRGDVATRPDCRSPARAGAGIWGKLQTHARVLGKAVETRSLPVGTRPHCLLMVQGDDERTEAVVAPYGRRKTANATAKGPAAIIAAGPVFERIRSVAARGVSERELGLWQRSGGERYPCVLALT